MFYEFLSCRLFLLPLLICGTGCSETKPPDRALPPSLQASALSVVQLDEQKNETLEIMADQPVLITGVLTSETRVRDKLLIRIEGTRKDGGRTIFQSGMASVTERGNGKYEYSASLDPVRKPGRYEVVVKYMDKDGTKIDSTDIEIKQRRPAGQK